MDNQSNKLTLALITVFESLTKKHSTISIELKNSNIVSGVIKDIDDHFNILLNEVTLDFKD